MPYVPSSPEITRWCALVIAIALCIGTIVSIVQIIDAENTGVAYYGSNPKLPATERVTKTASPAEFHDAVFVYGEHLLLCGVIAGISFWFYRRLSN